MKSTFAVLALAASALASPAPQGVTSAIAPSASAPAGCKTSYTGQFQISVYKAPSKAKRQNGLLLLNLANSKLTDQSGRTAYIASNYQFQFDSPPQTGAIYTSGFSVCANNSLALGGSTIFYQCLSGNFYNLYDRNWAPANCEAINIVALPYSSSSATGAASQASDGQPRASSAVPVSQLTDGQPRASSAGPAPITQISDGQPQAPTGRASSAPVISQISDGQPQAPTGRPSSAQVISQISDGQPQAPTGRASSAPVISQISDGQPQAPRTSSAAPRSSAQVISQISDGQPQAPRTSSAAVISQISDGQPQAPRTSTAAVITQISDGQPQAPRTSTIRTIGTTGVPVVPVSGNGTVSATAQPSQFTGAAAAATGYGLGALAAGVMGAVALF